MLAILLPLLLASCRHLPASTEQCASIAAALPDAAPTAPSPQPPASAAAVAAAVEAAAAEAAAQGWDLFTEGYREEISAAMPDTSWGSLSQHFSDPAWVAAQHAAHREAVLARLSASENGPALRLILLEEVLPYFEAPPAGEAAARLARSQELSAMASRVADTHECHNQLHQESSQVEQSLSEVTANADVLLWAGALRLRGGEAAIDAWEAVFRDLAESLPQQPLAGMWVEDDADSPVRVATIRNGEGVQFRDAQTGAVAIEGPYWHADPFGEDDITDVILLDRPATEGPSWDVAGFLRIRPTGEVVERAYFRDNGHDYYEEGLARYIEGDKIGFSTPAGEHVIAAQYDWATVFRGGVSIVCVGCAEQVTRPDLPEHNTEVLGGKWGAIDQTGAELVAVAEDSFEAVAAQVPRFRE